MKHGVGHLDLCKGQHVTAMSNVRLDNSSLVLNVTVLAYSRNQARDFVLHSPTIEADTISSLPFEWLHLLFPVP